MHSAGFTLVLGGVFGVLGLLGAPKRVGGFLLGGPSVMLASLFFGLFLLNFFGLGPFVYSVTGLFQFNILIALAFFIGVLTFLLLEGWVGGVSHLVPSGAPVALLTLLTAIESVSLIIRFLTLGVRLTANIVAGHMLLSLLSASLVGGVLLLILEVAVAMIQAFVFCLLLLSYWGEAD